MPDLTGIHEDSSGIYVEGRSQRRGDNKQEDILGAIGMTQAGGVNEFASSYI